MAAVKDDRLGALSTFNVAAPVRPGEPDALRAAIAQVGQGGASPFARLGSVHFARWVLLADQPRAGDTTLLFSATFDGSRERFISGLHHHLPDTCDAVFGCCLDWPGAQARDAAARWLLARRVPVHYMLTAYDATLPQIARAQRRRAALLDLAVRRHTLTPQELHAEFARLVAP